MLEKHKNSLTRVQSSNLEIIQKNINRYIYNIYVITLSNLVLQPHLLFSNLRTFYLSSVGLFNSELRLRVQQVTEVTGLLVVSSHTEIHKCPQLTVQINREEVCKFTGVHRDNMKHDVSMIYSNYLISGPSEGLQASHRRSFDQHH